MMTILKNSETADANPDSLELLLRRKTEAMIAGPLINAFADAFGKIDTIAIVERVVRDLAMESGKNFASVCKGTTLEDFMGIISVWNQNGALEIDILEKTSEVLSMNVTRCRYAEMYADLGMRDLGFSLSCARDFALVQGFNPEIRLVRTQTIMEGADYCDFRFSYRSPK